MTPHDPLLHRLGRTDLHVHPLCLGGNVFGWTANEQQSLAVLDAYAASGGNFIDTADVALAAFRGTREASQSRLSAAG